MKIIDAYIVAAALVALPATARTQVAGQVSHLKILINQTEVGSSDYTRQADGSFHCTSNIKLGKILVTSSVDGHFKGAHLLDARVLTKGPAGDVSLKIDGGQIVAVRNGKTTTSKYNAQQDLYAGNLIPALWKSTLDAAYQQTKGSTTGSVKLSPFSIEAGTEFPSTVKVLSPKNVTVNGSVQTARRFDVSVGSLELELDQSESGEIVAMDVPSQKLRMIEDGWDGLFVDPLAAYPELSQPSFNTKREANVRVKMRDGVELSTDLTLPVSEGKFPVVLIRTPYGREEEDLAGEFYAKRGYVLVCQDCRGRGMSDGDWDPFVHEGDDGYDTIGWIASQPWCNGKVGMIGGSYVGYVQWAAAVKRPPALKCIVPQVSPPDAMHNLPYDFGIPFLYADVWWAKIVAGKDIDITSIFGPLPNVKGLASLPISKADKATLGKTIPFYQTWLKRTTEKDWKGWDFLAHMDQANVPALHISGWWDGDGIGTRLNWAAERKLGRKDQWLIYGPWTHAFNSSRSLGKVDFGPTAVLELDSLYIRWFDTWLKGKDVGLNKVPHVRAFVTGANKWADLSDWPDHTEKPRTLFLGVDSLNPSVPLDSSETYTYDPSKDTDTSALQKGAGASANDYTGEVKLKDYKQAYKVFRSAPFAHDTAIAGPATIDLYFKSSARDTDFYGMLVDIDPAGKLYGFGQPGKIRASYRFGMNTIRALVPGQVNHVQLLPWDFAHEFKKGHRLGLVVVSSGFPMWARNLGNAEPPLTASKMVVQRNTLVFGAKTPSKLTVQVLWEK
jgi:hypothetical protein